MCNYVFFREKYTPLIFVTPPKKEKRIWSANLLQSMWAKTQWNNLKGIWTRFKSTDIWQCSSIMLLLRYSPDSKWVRLRTGRRAWPSNFMVCEHGFAGCDQGVAGLPDTRKPLGRGVSVANRTCVRSHVCEICSAKHSNSSRRVVLRTFPGWAGWDSKIPLNTLRVFSRLQFAKHLAKWSSLTSYSGRMFVVVLWTCLTRRETG